MKRAFVIAPVALALACAHLSPLSNTYTPVKRELTPHLSAEQAAAAEPVVIPLAALISEPELFHGQRVVTEGFVRDFMTQGVINGVGSVVVFLPQIIIIFFFILLLEATG